LQKNQSMKTILRFLLSAMCLLPVGAFAQANLDLNLTLGFPTSEFGDKTEAVGVGGSANIFFPVLKSTDAVQFGLGGGYMEYGKNRSDEILEINITQGGAIIDQIRIPMEIRATNSILHGQAALRVIAPNEGLRPYVQGSVGFRRLSTDTRVFDRSNERFFIDDDDESDLITSVNNLNDWIFSYGGGGGLIISFPSGFGINLGVQYMLGGRADFFDASDTEQWEVSFNGVGGFDPDDLNSDSVEVTTSPRSAKIDMLFVELGFHLNFGKMDLNPEENY
jgi:hypothetical protein